MEITELKEQANARSRMATKNTPEDSYYPMVSKHLLEEHPIEKLENLKKLDPDANVAEIRNNINHPEGESDAGRWYNCPNCAAAFELTERGYDVIARPKKNGSNVENIEDFFEHGELTNAAYETEIPQYPKEPEKYSTDPEVRKQQEEKLDKDIEQFWNTVDQTTKEVEGSLTHDILAQGINARGILVVGWLETDKRTTSFHAMNYKVNVDTHGKPFISIFDTQSRKKYKQNGGCELKTILYDTDPREVYFMRTDNLDLSELIASAVYSNKKG